MESSSSLPPPAVIHALARSLAGLPHNDQGSLPPPYHLIVATLEAADRDHRTEILGQQLAAHQLNVDAVLREIVSIDPTAPVPVQEAADATACPELPDGAMVDPGLGWATARWLDEYVAYARKVSPMTPALFHQSAGLWLVSVAVARRLRLKMPFGTIYPNLWILWIAPSTLYRKTTAMTVAADLAREAFAWLLTTGNVTPEALVSDLAGDQPRNLELLPNDLRDEWQKGRAFSAQRGMIMDEASGLFATMSKDYNRGLMELYLKLYDCAPQVDRRSNSQGLLVARNAYLSFLGASTPRAMRPYLTDSMLWNAGLWPRFGLLTPDRPPQYNQATDPGPALHLVKPLVQLYQRLPDATWPSPPESISVEPEREVLYAWERYARALTCDLLANSTDDGLNCAYGRMPTHLLKVATLLAALDWPEGQRELALGMPHFARAMEIVESWRASLHRAMAASAQSDYGDLSARITKQIAARDLSGGATMRDLCRYLGDKSPNEIMSVLRQMVAAGEVEQVFTTPGHAGGRPTTRYRLARE